MNEYPKIQTLFKRDANGIIIPTQYTLPEFKYLENNVWECTEKIDGTNIHIDLIPSLEGTDMTFNGRTERAVIPPHLLEKLKSIFDKKTLIDYFYSNKEDDLCSISIYGEGFGKKLQTNGSRYIKEDADFILFDIRIGKWWLTREALEQISKDLNLRIVPIIGYMTISEAMEYVKKGFVSIVSEDRSLKAEGLVLKTPNGLLLRSGERIVTKLKTADFNKFAAKYGADYIGEQPANQYY